MEENKENQKDLLFEDEEEEEKLPPCDAGKTAIAYQAPSESYP